MTAIMRVIFIFMISGMLTTAFAQEQIKTPQPSPGATLTQQIGIMEVTVKYSRPGIKDREIFGGLVPFGELWRTGANASTSFKFSDDVAIEGNKVVAGEYGLYTIPGQEEWTIIFNKGLGWGSGGYKEEEDAARFKVKPEKLTNTVETLTIEFDHIRDNWAYVVVSWENTLVKFKIEFDVDSKVMSQIEKEMADPMKTHENNFYAAASYYYNHDKDNEQALSWVNKAIEKNPDAFWMIRLKSQIQAKLGKYKEAIETAKSGIEAAKKAGNEQYVKFNQDAIAEWEKMK
ncbi:MAG: DUF2911 domain-containing protein [Calditrichaceae bacterium]|nr:DUF2911 domain-containing protein [Calditrichaceae bacterium]